MMLILYKGLIRSVSEYEYIVFDRFATTHILKLEKIQYRCLRMALGLMQSTHVQTLEVIDGVLNQGSIISISIRSFLLVDCPFDGNWR
jgi:hypothetical protein